MAYTTLKLFAPLLGAKLPQKKEKKEKEHRKIFQSVTLNFPTKRLEQGHLASSGFIAISDLNHLYPVVFKIETKLRNSHLLT